MALTGQMAAALRVITLTPLLDAAGFTRECGEAASTLEQIVSRGFAKISKSNKRDGRKTTLYAATLKGMLALEGFVPATLAAPAPPPAQKPNTAATSAPKSYGYGCPELGRTCLRPGAYDAFALPSLIGKERRKPKASA